MITDTEILQAALRYHETQASELRRQLGALRAEPTGEEKLLDLPPARKMSASARKRIAAAQKKRWADFHASKQAPATKKAPAKKPMSAARKKILAENLAKARAARAAKRKEA